MNHCLFHLRSLAALLCILTACNTALSHEPSAVSAADALHRLEQGNARFVSGHLSSTSPGGIAASRRTVAQTQKPFAVILGCSDSRVGPEVIFDQKLGDIFVIRTAGEVVDAIALGSIEYAVAHLGAPLIVVLGHERCGAVSAAVSGSRETGHIATLLKAIAPAVHQTKGQPGDPVDNAVCAHARDVVRQLQNAGPILKQAVHDGKVRIIAARYDLDSGKVSLLSATPK